MADEEQKATASQGAQAKKDMARCKDQPTGEDRRMQDALEDDDVRESLRELHAQKAKRSSGKSAPC